MNPESDPFAGVKEFQRESRESFNYTVLMGVLGMALVIAGSVMTRVGARGAAGSGLVLDPERARRDLEPWSRMAGGVVGDAVDEMRDSGALPSSAPPAVRVRCTKCKALNAEDAKFCGQCGAAL